jgi:hypothetical protein
LHAFEEGTDVSWFGVVDNTPGAEVGVDDPTTPTVDHNPVLETLDDVRERGPQEPGRCGETTAGVFRARGFSDWGAFFADYSTVSQSIIPDRRTGGGWEGISFWARTSFESDRSFFFLVDNAHTAEVVPAEEEAEQRAAALAAASTDAGAGSGDAGAGTPTYVSPNQCVPEIKDEEGNGTGEYPPGTDAADTCGNAYVHTVTTSEHWQFFTLPFSEFIQDRARPNVRKDGFDTSVQLVRLTIRFSVEADIELWMDEVALYRRLDQ